MILKKIVGVRQVGPTVCAWVFLASYLDVFACLQIHLEKQKLNVLFIQIKFLICALFHSPTNVEVSRRKQLIRRNFILWNNYCSRTQNSLSQKSSLWLDTQNTKCKTLPCDFSDLLLDTFSSLNHFRNPHNSTHIRTNDDRSFVNEMNITAPASGAPADFMQKGGGQGRRPEWPTWQIY